MTDTRQRLSNVGALVAAAIAPGLMSQTWSIARRNAATLCHAFFVDSGTAEFVNFDGKAVSLTGPAALWLPQSARGAVQFAAGSHGSFLSVPEDLVWQALGDSGMFVFLRPASERIALASSDGLRPYVDELRMSFAAIIRETRDEGPGAGAMMSLHLTLILTHFWRASGLAEATGLRGMGAGTIQRFRQLVELHYRESPAIDHFARQLGVTRTHLHAACLKATGRTPLKVLHDRLIEEACARLTHTELPIEQIGYGLGFRDAAYFSRFFKRLTGQAPGAYRAAIAATQSQREAPSFAAWP